MSRLGPGELMIILAIALLVVGPSKLPELGKSLGKTISEFKKFSSGIKDDLTVDNTPKKEDSDKEDK